MDRYGEKMSELIKIMVLGVIQGFTEFLPVSSSGHLLLFRKLFNLSEAGLFLDTMLHFGTLVALFTIFWQDIMEMIKRPLARLPLLIVVGTIPAVVAGLLFKDTFEELARTGVTVGWEFLATGLVLWFADKIKDKGFKDIQEVSYSDALIIGCMQAVAILPAISRSGLTIAGSLFRKVERKSAARFSFLLSIPAILGAVVLQGKDLLEGRPEPVSTAALIAGVVAAAFCSYVAVKWMMKIIQHGSLKGFAVYVWIIGGCIIIAQLLGKF